MIAAIVTFAIRAARCAIAKMGATRVQGVNGTMRAVSHCTECYLERHPPVEVGLPVMVAATAQAEGEEGDLRQEENAA